MRFFILSSVVYSGFDEDHKKLIAQRKLPLICGTLDDLSEKLGFGK